MTSTDLLLDINRKIDLILHRLGEGKKSYDLEQEAEKVIRMKLTQRSGKGIKRHGSAKKR